MKDNLPIVILPARAGSKRIIGKNVKTFHGVPVICRTINLLREMGIFGEIIVSTESIEIKTIVESCGASVPFIRPSFLADDDTPTLPVIQHAIEALKVEPDRIVVCVYPTSIFLERSLILDALTLMSKSPMSIVFPIKQYPAPIERRLEYDKESTKVQILSPEVSNLPSQAFRKFWYDISEFYLTTSKTWQSATSLYENAIGVEADHHLSVDINDMRDWELAERLMPRAKSTHNHDFKN